MVSPTQTESTPTGSPVDAQRDIEQDNALPNSAAAETALAKIAPPPSVVARLDADSDPQEPVIDTTPADETEIVQEPLSDRSRQIASHSGFSLLPLKSFEPESAAQLEVRPSEPSTTATIHATRLREIAQESLRISHHRLQRQATHSAKKYALEALRSIVSMRDAQVGGNHHAKQLEIAFDAIRESEDFCGRFGVIDQNALKRMVGVHETLALKDQDLENISSLEATESYLAVARSNLALAAGGAREASDALVLLGQIEKQMSRRGDTHAAAVAVTLQRAAIEIEPENAMGYRELGATLLQQGLVQQAAWALNKSVELRPTRAGYERLLEASRRLGDVDTARVCLASLEDPRMQDEIPFQQLTPEAFASTHRPNLASVEPAKAKPPTVEGKPRQVEASKVSFRSLFPFKRR